MASNRMLRDTATIFVPLDEDSDGIMQYDVYLMQSVFCRVSSGSTLNTTSLTADDTLTLYAFDRKSVVKKNGANMPVATACESIFHVIRADGNTSSEKCYIVPYDASDNVKPPAHSRRASKAYRRMAGSPRMWHWEVHAM